MLGLPRGGVPVAAAVARALGGTLDVLVVRKLGTPLNPELAMGAIASGGGIVLDDDVIASLRISRSELNAVVERERDELERREAAYRGGRPPPVMQDRDVILVDDGIATGSTMLVAVLAIRELDPASITVAVPVAPPDSIDRLSSIADHVEVVMRPTPFFAVGTWYTDFTQTTDEEVKQLLAA